MHTNIICSYIRIWESRGANIPGFFSSNDPHPTVSFSYSITTCVLAYVNKEGWADGWMFDAK